MSPHFLTNIKLTEKLKEEGNGMPFTCACVV